MAVGPQFYQKQYVRTAAFLIFIETYNLKLAFDIVEPAI